MNVSESHSVSGGHNNANTRLRHGIGLMLLGTSIVPIMDAVAKHLGDSMSPVQITWGRFLFQFIIMAIALCITIGPKALVPNEPLKHAARGLLLAGATVCFFWSLRSLPLADAIAIFFVQPMILTLISAIVLKEHIGWHRRIAVCVGFIGALFIIKPGTDAFALTSLLPLLAAVLFASYLAMTRAVANIDHPATMQFISGLSATCALTLILMVLSLWPDSSLAPSKPSTVEWGWLLLIGAIAAGGHLLVVMAMNRAPASALAPFGYVEIIAATLLGWLFFSDWPDRWSWLGIAIKVGSGIYVFLREQRVTESCVDDPPEKSIDL